MWLLLLYFHIDGRIDWKVFAVVFFVMVLTLGIGAASSLTGALISTVIDSFSSLPRWLVSLLFCLVGFSIGLVYITPVCYHSLHHGLLSWWIIVWLQQVGLMLVDIVDYFGGGIPTHFMFMFHVHSNISLILRMHDFYNCYPANHCLLLDLW